MKQAIDVTKVIKEVARILVIGAIIWAQKEARSPLHSD